jgi:hypothetical protein
MVAGWLFIISALIGWYTATAMLLDAMVGHSVLPLGDNADTTQPMGSERVGEPGSVPGPAPASRRIG